MGVAYDQLCEHIDYSNPTCEVLGEGEEEEEVATPVQQPGVSYPLGTIGVDPWDPDPFLAPRSEPSTKFGQRLAKMRNGDVVAIVEERPDGWWYVQNLRLGMQGWAKSGSGYGRLTRLGYAPTSNSEEGE